MITNFYLVHFIVSLSMVTATGLILGAFALLRDTSVKVNRAFAINAFFVVWWSVGELGMIIPGNLERSWRMSQFLQFAATWIPASLTYFTEELLAHSNNVKDRRALLCFIVSVPISILAFTRLFIDYPISKFDDSIVFVTAGKYDLIFIIWFIAITSYAILLLACARRRTVGRERTQISWVMWALIIGYTGGSSNFLLTYGFNVFPLAPFCNYAVVTMYFIIALAVSKYRLMDIDDIGAITQRARLSALGTLTACISHEVKNPLYLIRSLAAESAVQPSSNSSITVDKNISKSNAALDKITKHADRALEIISRFNSLAIPNARFSVTSMDLTKCIEDALELLRHDIEAKRISILRDLPTALFVNADFGAVQEVFINLIKNACEHMTANGILKLSADERARRVIVSITDSGPGIAKEKRDEIFEPYFTTKMGGKGSGLGLFLVKELLKRNNAAISLVSSDRQGSTFQLSFEKSAPRYDSGPFRI